MVCDILSRIMDTITGGRLVIGNFTLRQGRKLESVIDETGRVYKVHPYDVPQEPMKVLAFSLNHVLMMIDTGRLKVSSKGPFLTEEECAHFRGLTQDLLREVECEEIIGQKIDYQPVGQ